MKKCKKCGDPVTHSGYSNVCLKCRKFSGTSKPKSLERTHKKNEGKEYLGYNPDYNSERSFTTFGREAVMSMTERQKSIDKLNNILQRKPADEYKKYI